MQTTYPIIEGFQVRRLLGSGSFGHVYQCLNLQQNRCYAIKMIKKNSMGSSKLRSFAKQADILSTIQHKNIVKFYSFHNTPQCLIIKMELIKGGTLKKLLEDRKKKGTPFTEAEVALFLKNLLEGIRYLHCLNIIHRDLKPENILFEDCDDLSTVKIVDFGLSAKLEIHNPTNIKAQCGTLLYMAPEMFNKPSYTKSVDLWSCAVIMFMLFNLGKHPFYAPGMKIDQFKARLKNQPFPQINEPLAQNFLQKLSKRQYQQRYNVSQALKHPWITRNKEDQIPLSIHESFKGFDSTSEIITLLRLYLTIGHSIPHKRVTVDEFYRSKANDFISNNEAVRVYSPSRRKVRDKNNQLFNKMNKIFHHTKQVKPDNSPPQNISQEESPTLKKHQSYFLSLFDRQKSFDLKSSKDKFQYKNQEENIFKNYESSEKLQFYYNLHSDRIIAAQNQAVIQLSRPYSKTSSVNNQYKVTNMNIDSRINIEQQIEQSVNAMMLSNLNETANKRRIFQKKQSIDDRDKDPKDKNPRLIKKYSQVVDQDKNQSVAKNNNYSLSTKQIYNRRTMSPMKGHFSKPMVFSVNTKNYPSTHRK